MRIDTELDLALKNELAEYVEDYERKTRDVFRPERIERNAVQITLQDCFPELFCESTSEEVDMMKETGKMRKLELPIEEGKIQLPEDLADQFGGELIYIGMFDALHVMRKEVYDQMVGLTEEDKKVVDSLLSA